MAQIEEWRCVGCKKLLGKISGHIVTVKKGTQFQEGTNINKECPRCGAVNVMRSISFEKAYNLRYFKSTNIGGGQEELEIKHVEFKNIEKKRASIKERGIVKNNQIEEDRLYSKSKQQQSTHRKNKNTIHKILG